MVKWIKLFGNQYLGFWVFGLVLFAIQEIPYMIMPLLKLESNPIMNMQESSLVLNTCEKILGSICIALMTFILGLTIPPCVAFLFFAVDRKNYISVIPIAIFTVCHIIFGVVNFII